MRLSWGKIGGLLFLAACQATTNPASGLRIQPASKLARQQPDQSVDGLALGHRLMAQGKYLEALDAYTAASGQYGLTADVLSALGSANLKLGRLREARTLLESAVEKDPKFVAAWNNLGVVLMETDHDGEARRAFRNAYALDNGNSDQIRKNLTLAIAKSENAAYVPKKQNKFELVRRGNGRYLLLSTPETNKEQ